MTILTMCYNQYRKQHLTFPYFSYVFSLFSIFGYHHHIWIPPLIPLFVDKSAAAIVRIAYAAAAAGKCALRMLLL